MESKVLHIDVASEDLKVQSRLDTVRGYALLVLTLIHGAHRGDNSIVYWADLGLIFPRIGVPLTVSGTRETRIGGMEFG